jgi:hypothetical protein
MVLARSVARLPSEVRTVRQRRLMLDEQQRAELIRLRDKALKPYLRERAAAILKVAQGIPASVVAREGLLRPRDPDSVLSWLGRFEDEGVKGLLIRKGRGRKPAFSPSAPGG